MNEREQFEEMARSLGTGGWQTLDDMVKFGIACAESKNTKIEFLEAIIAGDGAVITGLKADLDKANARIAQLKQFIAENVYTDEKYDEIITESTDTWLLEHDKAVELKVLEKVANNCTCSFDLAKVLAMIESMK